MSSALVRQALQLVDPEESIRGRSKKAKRPVLGQERTNPYQSKYKNQKVLKPQKSAKEVTEENIKKLLALSKPTADPNITKKIIQRATDCKPLFDKPAKKKDDGKSILFPEDEGKSILFPEGEGNSDFLVDRKKKSVRSSKKHSK